MANLSFTDLPGEIRNEIYTQLLVIPCCYNIRSLHNQLHPNILSTCRQVYEEARQIIYGSNTFLAHPSRLAGLPKLHTYDFVSSPILISLIRRYHVGVRLDCDANFQAQNATDSFTGMEELTIEVFQSQFGSSDYSVLRLFEGVRGVKKARVYGSVQAFPEYVEWLQNTIQTPKDVEIEKFDKEQVGRMLAERVRSYDIWTVRESLTRPLHMADDIDSMVDGELALAADSLYYERGGRELCKSHIFCFDISTLVVRVLHYLLSNQILRSLVSRICIVRF